MFEKGPSGVVDLHARIEDPTTRVVLNGVGLMKSDEIRIVDNTVICGHMGSGVMTRAVT